jgi:hypothetical protein
MLAATLLAGLVAAPAAGAASTWFVSNSPTGAGATISFGFGEPGDVFVAGDWDGDGTDTPGVFRRRPGQDSLWILSNSPTGAGPLITFAFGISSDLPVVGDWDQTGTDNAGVLRPDPGGTLPGTFFLASADVNGGGNTASFTFGNPGDTPIAGDWDGDLRGTIGIHRAVGSQPGFSDFVEVNVNATTNVGDTIPFGNGADTPLTGDWDGNGIDTPGVFLGVGTDGRWETKANNASGDSTSSIFAFGLANDSPVAGDWDKNGTSTPAVVRPGLAFVGTTPTVGPAGAGASTAGVAGGGAAGGGGAGGANGANASRDAKVTAVFKGRRSSSRRVRFTASPTVTGRLVDANGTAIGGAAVVAQARMRQSRATTSPIGTLTTGADGTFTYRVPSGPSRTITFAYTAFSGDPTPAATSAALRTLVTASLTAKATPRSPRAGQRLHVAGRLRYLPRANIQIVIQARDGRVWRTVGTVKTRAGGRYSWPYRFKPAARGHTFAFRTHVDSPVYPFTPGNSRTLTVRVR